MSPRLERALSEALEEELTHELAPLLEPIISRVKARIPAIIENCRLKLMRTSQNSDDETVSTPSLASPSVDVDKGPRASKKASLNQGSTTPSHCSDSSFEVISTPKSLSRKALGKRPQCAVPSPGDINVESQQELVTPGSSTDFSMFYQSAAACPEEEEETRDPSWNMDDFFNTGDENDFFALQGCFTVNNNAPIAESGLVGSADMCENWFG